jgi:PKD repeat protein
MIAPFQGFFVHSNATGSYPISGAKRTRSTAGSFHAQANDQQLSITAANTTSGLADITMVAFNNDATTQFDNDYDAQKIAGTLGRHTLYTVGANNLWMSKNVLHDIATTSTVTMGFEPEVSGSYTFSFEGLNSFDPTSYITLEDRKLNTFYDVRNGDYNFTADSADQWERFVLHFTPAAQITTTDENCNTLGNIIVTQPGTANWNYTITDNNNATIASGTLNETTPINAAAQTGTYVITLVDNNNYTVAKTVTVSGTSPVTAVFTPSVTVAETNQAVSFNSSSVATNYYWDFGDGTTATGQNAIHNYSDTGTYTVTLIVISEGGCSSTTTQTITVNQTATGITTLNNKAAINIWSNENKVYIDFSQMAKTDATIAIYNVLGQELVNEKFARSIIYNKAILNTEATYVIVKVKNGDVVITKKVFIANVK